MPEIKSVLVSVALSEEGKQKLKAYLSPAHVIFYPHTDKEGIAEAIHGCDVAILNGNIDETILADKDLKWVHCCVAGIEKSAKAEIFERGIILTSSSGRSAPALAEHALMFMLALTYDLPGLLNAQRLHRWGVSKEYGKKTGMFGKTVGIIGLGKTGREVARLCKMFDMNVLGYRRSSGAVEYVDEIYTPMDGKNLKNLLNQSDYVVLSCELNDDTYHMIGKEELAWMKKSAFLINMGRGKLIDEPRLIDALKNGSIAGAGLDTFEQEPLPYNNSLWDLPNVIITPHVTPQLTDKEDRMLRYVYENIKAYRQGNGFVNRATEANMFTH